MNLNDFKNWALAQGQVGNPNPGNTYLGQCVSLVQQYLNKVYGIGWTPRGDAVDWPSNANVLSYFDKVSSPQAGDIGVMGKNFGEGYGHIFIYLSPTTILEQNGRTPLRVTTGSAYANPIAILRRKGQTQGDIVNEQDAQEVYSTGLHRPAENREVLNQFIGLQSGEALRRLRGADEWKSQDAMIKNYKTLADTVEALKQNPTKADLQAVVDKFNAEHQKVLDLEANADSANTIVVKRSWFNSLFDKIKSYFNKG